MATEPVAFGPFLFRPDNGTLFRDRELVAIGQRGAQLLGALLKSPREVVTKAELMEAAWPGTAVEESNLSVQIASLRKLLGLAPGGHEWIVTVPRIGYRFVDGPHPTSPTQKQVAAPAALIPSLAVLPFENLSGDPEQGYFADGVVEDIITALSRFKSFAVIAHNSSFVYKGRAVDVRQVAVDLGVRYVLEGSVRRADSRFRIGAQLINGANGSHLWADNFDGASEDIFDVQDRITASVVALVEPKIQQAEIERSRRERPGSIAAYDLYLRALSKLRTFHQADNAVAYSLLTEAVRLEPENGIYLVHAAWALEHRNSMGWPPIGSDDIEKCLQLAGAAMAVAQDNATILAHGGLIVQLLGREYELGLFAIKRAVELNPNNIDALTNAGVGHMLGGLLEDALTFFHRAILLNPGDTFEAMAGISYAKTCLGRYEEALEWAARSHASNPNYSITHWNLIAANAHLGRLDEAKQALAAYLAVVPEMSLARVISGPHFKDPQRLTVLVEGMRMAGMPET